MTNIYIGKKQPLEVVPTVMASTTFFWNSVKNI
jgi:hypothetical protein